MMNFTRLITSLFVITTFANTAFAESAIPPEFEVPSDEGTQPTDGGSAASDPGSNVEIIATDAGTPSGSFSPNPCWDEQCSAESANCQGDADCSAFNACWKHSGTAEEKQACFEDLAAELGQEAYDAANSLHQLLRECGWSACNDPNAGSCADAGKDGAANRCGQWDDSWFCNCDTACDQFNDCCADMDDVCSSEVTCEGKCESADPVPDGLGNNCYCDEACLGNGDCCPDYEAKCGGSTCTPDCFGKQCGNDGCGGSCGNCEGNFVCNADAQCEAPGTTPGSDNGSTSGDNGTSVTPGPDSGSSNNPDGTVAADTGSTPGTGSSDGDSGGCSANSDAQTPWALVLLCAALTLGLRRRRSFEL